MESSLRILMVSLMTLNILACSTPKIQDAHPILDYSWKKDVYNMLYATLEDVDNFRFWVRRTPTFPDGSPHKKVCVEVAQPGYVNRFYLANINTYGLMEVNSCEGEYTFSNFISPKNYTDFDEAKWLAIDGLNVKLTSDGLYQLNFSNLFPVNKYKLTKQGKKTLLNVLEQVKQWPVKHISIYGVADSSGEYSYNKSLADQRALTVKNFLIEEGLNNIPISLRGSVENGLASAEERISQRRFIIEMKLYTQ